MPLSCTRYFLFFLVILLLFFFNDPATTEIYTLPYTTLFRSQRGREPALRPVREPHGRGVRQDQDRKSTRLNSSHEWISYAVFCLKKKKKKKNTKTKTTHTQTR